MRGLPPCRAVQRHPRHAARDPLPAAGRQRLRDDGRHLRRPRLGRRRRRTAASATTSTPRSRPINDAGPRRLQEARSARCRTWPDARASTSTGGARGTSPTARSSSARSASECKGSSKSLAPAVYAKLARAMRGELKPRPAAGRRRARRPRGRAQVRHLDLRVLRRPARRRRLQRRRLRPARILQARRRRRRPGRGRRPRRGPRPARRARSGKPIWVTESGVGGPHVGDERSPKRREHPGRLPGPQRVAAPLERRPARGRRLPVHLPRRPGLPGRPGRRQARRRRGRPTTCSRRGAATASPTARRRRCRPTAGPDAGMGASIYDERPWLARYAEGQPADIEPEHPSAPGHVRRPRCAARPTPSRSTTATSALSFGELDERSGAFAAALAQRGVVRGDRDRRVPAERPGVRRRACWRRGSSAPSRCRSTRCSRSARCARCSRTASRWCS